jgi:hypothetical protein
MQRNEKAKSIKIIEQLIVPTLNIFYRAASFSIASFPL